MEWRTKDHSNVKIYDQKRTVDYADCKVGLFYIFPFDLFVEGEPAIAVTWNRLMPMNSQLLRLGEVRG